METICGCSRESILVLTCGLILALEHIAIGMKYVIRTSLFYIFGLNVLSFLAAELENAQ